LTQPYTALDVIEEEKADKKRDTVNATIITKRVLGAVS
jgi:hypothetical protein